MEKAVNNKQLYIGSAVIVTVGMLVVKGVATIINLVVVTILT